MAACPAGCSEKPNQTGSDKRSLANSKWLHLLIQIVVLRTGISDLVHALHLQGPVETDELSFRLSPSCKPGELFESPADMDSEYLTCLLQLQSCSCAECRELFCTCLTPTELTGVFLLEHATEVCHSII